MPPKQTIHQVVVTPSLRLKSRRKASNSVVNCFWLIWLVVKELRIVRAIIRIGKQKEQKSTSRCLV